MLRFLLLVATLLGVSSFAFAQETPSSSAQGAARFTLEPPLWGGYVNPLAPVGSANSFRSLNSAWYGPVAITLDARQFSFPHAFGWVEAQAESYLPAFTTAALPPGNAATSRTRNAVHQPVTLLPRFDYIGGEAGFFYGQSIGGKNRRDVEAGYLFSEIVEGNTHISVGISYQHSDYRRK